MLRPNVVLITVECWRGDHFGAATPRMAALARDSVVFSDASSAGGWTRVAMTALMSSAYASMYGAVALATPERRTLAECLLENQYWTAGFTANPVCGAAAGFHRGFGVFLDARKTKPDLLPGASLEGDNWMRFIELGVPPGDVSSLCNARLLTDKACSWLENRQDGEPYFLWLHYLDPHFPCFSPSGPFTPQELRDSWFDRDLFKTRVFPAKGRYDPGDEVRARYLKRYRAALEVTDSEIGRLVDQLCSRPDWDRTIVAVTGDHGEEFFEHGTWHHSWNQLNREGIHVPLFMRIPGVPHRELSTPVGHLHVAPTILDFAGIRKPSAMRGDSLRSLIEIGDNPRGAIVTEMFGHKGSYAYRLALRDGIWKYIYDFEEPHDSKLYNLSSDPEERNNLRGTEPDIFRRFEKMRLAHVTLGLSKLMLPLSTTPGVRRSQVATCIESALLNEQMAALGYL